jgi:predicted Zn-dependent protease with MMP-like domain
VAETVRVKGLREFVRACDHAGKETKREVRNTFREVGDIVKVEAAKRFESIDARSAAGFRTVVRQRGVSVEQRLRKTTGLRPDFGTLQMRVALLPALDFEEGNVERKLEHTIDEIADHFER